MISSLVLPGLQKKNAGRIDERGTAMITEALKPNSCDATLVSNMYKDIHRWAVWLLVLGVVNLVFVLCNELDFTWIFFLITAALSLKTRIPQMFRLYAVLVGGAAVSNVIYCFTNGEWGWFILPVLQIVWTIGIVRQYRKYRQLSLADLYQSGNWPEKLGPPQEESVILGRFAKASLLITLFMFILFSIACIGIVIYGFSLASQGYEMPETVVNQPPETAVTQPSDENQGSSVFDVFLSMPLLALGLSTAALVPENPKRDLALVGVIINSIILGLYLALIIIGSLAVARGINP
jgi:hypothetical protein